MWLWTNELAAELTRRGRRAIAAQLDSCVVARRYDGPPLPSLGDTSLEVLAAMLVA